MDISSLLTRCSVDEPPPSREKLTAQECVSYGGRDVAYLNGGHGIRHEYSGRSVNGGCDADMVGGSHHACCGVFDASALQLLATEGARQGLSLKGRFSPESLESRIRAGQ